MPTSVAATKMISALNLCMTYPLKVIGAEVLLQAVQEAGRRWACDLPPTLSCDPLL
jgi:hypothetical protein